MDIDIVMSSKYTLGTIGASQNCHIMLGLSISYHASMLKVHRQCNWAPWQRYFLLKLSGRWIKIDIKAAELRNAYTNSNGVFVKINADKG